MTAQEHMPNPEKSTIASPTAGQLELSPERWAFLAPRLTALLADFSKLDDFVSSDSQPAMTAELADEVRRD
ncbi:MAG TPA: hypothetical protein VHV31_06305 [Nitrolancea sp.]|jgi:hypothetical protein|nr:hypothetical protein [Nitrolancea sp.]